jgi:tRNA threonylcarbamoyl adenosine modification protein YjeE
MIINSLKDFSFFIKNFTLFVKNKLKKNKKLLILLEGPLGVGKTTFVKILAKNLGIKKVVNSPTFIIWQIYEFKINKEKFFLNHIDLYRIKPRDILKLSLSESINKKGNLFVIEWGEKIKRYLNNWNIFYIEIKIKYKEKSKRKIYIKWKK